MFRDANGRFCKAKKSEDKKMEENTPPILTRADIEAQKKFLEEQLALIEKKEKENKDKELKEKALKVKEAFDKYADICKQNNKAFDDIIELKKTYGNDIKGSDIFNIFSDMDFEDRLFLSNAWNKLDEIMPIVYEEDICEDDFEDIEDEEDDSEEDESDDLFELVIKMLNK